MRQGFLIASILIFIFAGCKHKEKEPRPIKSSPSKTASAKAPIKYSSEATGFMKEKMGISKNEITQNKLFSFACEWYGTPYKYAGCQRSGIDCSCFSNILYEKVYNKKIPRTAAEMYANCRKLGIEDANEGDLLFFKITGNLISHVGVFLKGKYFVHSSTGKGVVISSIEEPYYKKYFYCAGRIRNA